MNKKGTPKNLKPWKKGQSGNPDGGPKGKRISTWVLELGALDELPDKHSLPINGQIAHALLKKAIGEFCERSIEIIMERTEGAVDKTFHLKHDGIISGLSDEQKAEILRNALNNAD